MKVKTHKKNQGSVRLLKVSMVWAVLLILMAVFVVVAVAIGSAGYSFTSIVQTLYRAVTGQGLTEEESTILVVVLSLRLPRVLLALLVGAALSAAGALLQAVMRNPLADPGTIGVSARRGHCRHHRPAHLPQPDAVPAPVRLRRRGSGLCAHLRPGLEGRSGPGADHFVRRGHQLGVGGL